MVIVPPGSFLMGSPPGERGDAERPQHKVTIARPFAVGRFAVTFEEWDRALSRSVVTGQSSAGCGFRVAAHPDEIAHAGLASIKIASLYLATTDPILLAGKPIARHSLCGDIAEIDGVFGVLIEVLSREHPRFGSPRPPGQGGRV